jgi:hypothetical protein
VIRRLLLAAAFGVAGCASDPNATTPRPGDPVRDEAQRAIDFEEKEIAELPLKLPAPPQQARLIAFDPGNRSTLKFFVDPESISVGTDKIVRFTVVAVGEGAARNVTYEAIRCGTRERKVYANGRPDGTWAPVRNPQWTKIGGLGSDGYRFTLYNEYFCPARQMVKDEQEALQGFRRGGHPRSQDMLAPGTMVR